MIVEHAPAVTYHSVKRFKVLKLNLKSMTQHTQGNLGKGIILI